MFFSDIHGNKYVLPKLIKAIQSEKPDRIYFCGDNYGYYYHQEEIIRFFIEFNVHSILGNHDKYFLDLIDNKIDLESLVLKYGNSYKMSLMNYRKESIEYLRELKPNLEITLDNLKLGIFHGSALDYLQGRIYPDTLIANEELYKKFDFVILGHTHYKMKRLVENTTILNPGSIGQQRDGLGCSYMILDTITKTSSFKILEFDLDSLVNDINQNDPRRRDLIEVLFRKRPSSTP